MENIIKMIVDMDRQAQAITDAAQQEKLSAESEIAAEVAAMRADYLERARRRIDINGETDRTIAEQNWRRQSAIYERQLAPLEERFSVHRAEWAQRIFADVLGEYALSGEGGDVT